MAKKRLVLCCDGTWNNLEMRYITNVGRLAQALGPNGKSVDGKPIPQTIFYDDGVGADENGLKRLAQGAFGWGIDRLIFEAYRFIALNYEPNDEVCLFGFSRGAFVARSVAGMIGRVGLVPRSELKLLPEAMDVYREKGTNRDKKHAEFRKKASSQSVQITLLGCWDTVGALGVPDKLPLVPIDNLLRRRYQFHDTKLGKHVERALHAVAIDERRKEFAPTLMHKPKGAGAKQKLVQSWFPGDHGCVGGGSWEKRGLSNHCLRWMVEQASALGVDLGVDFRRLHDQAISDHRIFFSPNTSVVYGTADRKIPDFVTYADIDDTARKRWADLTDYRPKKLKARFGSKLEAEKSTNVKAPSTGRLSVGQSADVVTKARRKNLKSGIKVQKGETYQIEVLRTQVWKDGDLDPCDVRGWSTDGRKDPWEDGKKADLGNVKSWLIKKGRKLKLNKNADWFELVCRIGDKEHQRFRIKLPPAETDPFVEKFKATATGELTFAANDAANWLDALDKYDNNEGWAWIRITRKNA